MIDLNEDLIPISQVPGEFPSRPHIATVWRWVTRGVRGVKLATVHLGGRRFSSREAIQRFVEATTGVDSTLAATTGVDSTKVPTPSRRQAVHRADAELDQAKI